jgi:hypothetical protein
LNTEWPNIGLKKKIEKIQQYMKTGYPVAVAVIEMGITEYPGCGCGYDKLTATATDCTPLSGRLVILSYKDS